MAVNVASLNIKLGASTGALAGNLATAQGMISAFSSKVNAGGSGLLGQALGGVQMGQGGAMGMLGGLAKGITPVTAGLAGLTAVVAGATWATKLAADAEQMQVSFEVMLGSADKAKSMMSDIQSFAASTPFESTEISAAAKALLAFGVSQDQVIPSMRMLGDLSAGLNIPIGELSELYGKAKVQGRLFMEDINQLTGRGIPIITQLAKNFGVAEGEIRGMVEEGRIGFPQLQAALFEMTKEGSQFGGMMEKQSQTFWGQLSTLWDNIKIAVGGVGKQFIGILTEMLKLVNAALESWNKFWGNTPQDAGKFKPLDQKLIAEGMKPGEDGKAAAKEAKKAAKEAEKAMERIRAAGESLTKSLRTPFERVVDELAHAKELFDAGAISAETWQRAMAKASEDLRAQQESAEQIRNRLQAQQGGPVAALQFGQQGTISALNEARREQKLQADVAKEQLKQQQILNQKVDKLIRAVSEKDGIDITEVNL